MDERHKTYRAWDARPGSQTAVSPRDALPEDDLVFFVLDAIPGMDLSAFHEHDGRELHGQPPYDVTMMVTLLPYADAVGVCSSRKIAAACERNLAFRAIVNDAPPDFRTLSDFRKIHGAAFRPLLVEVRRLAGALGLVQRGNLSTDGTKMKANASRPQAMSYGYMTKDIARLEAEVEQLLAPAEQTDAEQDAGWGSRRGDEWPAELKRREDRWAKIRAAKARLEAEAPARAEDEQRRRDDEQARREEEGRPRRGQKPAPVDPTPEDKAQTNFTDPEATIMKQSHQGFDYSWNAPAVVDGRAPIIVAAEVSDAANDKRQGVPMGPAALDNLAAAGIEPPKTADGTRAAIKNTLDNGDWSEETVEKWEGMGLDPPIATGRQKHNQSVEVPAPAVWPTTANAQEKMAEKLRSPIGRALDAARKHIVEPVFGQIKSARGIRTFLLRGQDVTLQSAEAILPGSGGSSPRVV